jgi:hypothetical protein
MCSLLLGGGRKPAQPAAMFGGCGQVGNQVGDKRTLSAAVELDGDLLVAVLGQVEDVLLLGPRLSAALAAVLIVSLVVTAAAPSSCAPSSSCCSSASAAAPAEVTPSAATSAAVRCPVCHGEANQSGQLDKWGVCVCVCVCVGGYRGAVGDRRVMVAKKGGYKQGEGINE